MDFSDDDIDDFAPADCDDGEVADLVEYCDSSDCIQLTMPDEEMKPLALLYEIPQSTQKQKDIEDLFNTSITTVCSILGIPDTVAVPLLKTYRWDANSLIDSYTLYPENVMRDAGILPLHPKPSDEPKEDSDQNISECQVCLSQEDEMVGLNCDHVFCVECWKRYLIEEISNGAVSEIACMSQNCAVKVTGELARYALKGTQYLEVYNSLFFNDLVKSHPLLRRCVGPDCTEMVIAQDNGPKRIVCGGCKSEFCFKCGGEYHSFVSCELKKNWLKQCQPDENTMKYIQGKTKDCPKCFACIEKNGGCEHIACPMCKYQFCWFCLEDWNPQHRRCKHHVVEATKRRDTLDMYVGPYVRRYANQADIIKQEKQKSAQIQARIEKSLTKPGCETARSDWKFLEEAAEKLRLFRLTLQYSHAFAFSLKPSPSKELFQHRQGLLEEELEMLTKMIDKAELQDKWKLLQLIENCELRRTTLIRE